MRGTVWQIVRALVLMSMIAVVDYALLRAGVRYLPSVRAALVVSALAVQTGLSSVWAAIGRDRLLLRLVVLLASLGCVWWFLRHWHERSEREMATGFWVQAVIVIGSLVILRVLGFRTTRAGEVASLGPAPLLPRFSIRGIFVLTGLVCASLAVVLRMRSLRVESDAMVISCIVGLFHAGLTLSAVASTLIFRHAALFVALVCGGGLLVGWGIGRAIQYDELVATVSIAVPVSVQTLALLIARAAGYRFMRSDSVPLAGEPLN